MSLNPLASKPSLIVIGVLLASIIMSLAFPEGFNRVNRQPNFIGVVDLAQKIKNRESFSLIDLRNREAFDEFHIPTATHIPHDEVKAFLFEHPAIFYSGDDLLSRKLWDMLPDSLRDRTTIVYGGVRDWYDRLLYPTLPYGEEVNDKVILKTIHDLCEFYGGFAEFENDASLLEYYQMDLSSAAWPKVQVGGNLVRKGC